MPGPQKKVIEYEGQRVEATVVLVESQVENLNTYNLEDGCQIRMRTVVVEVLRLDGRYNADGETIYLTKSKNLLTANVPEKFRRPKGV